jgi:hypothetical protein
LQVSDIYFSLEPPFLRSFAQVQNRFISCGTLVRNAYCLRIL